jgi:hypothetical protein
VGPLGETFEKGDLDVSIALIRFWAGVLLRWSYFFNPAFLVGSSPSPLYLSPLLPFLGTDAWEGILWYQGG